MISITSRSNARIKEVRSLYRRKERLNKGLFIVEGIKIIEECIDNCYPLAYIIYSEDLFNIKGGKELFEKIKNFNELINVPNELFESISDTENPQGILGVSKSNIKSIENIKIKENSFLLLLDEVQDPGNMGTIIRTGDAFGVDGIITTEGCVDIYNPKVVRATMGSIFRVPIYHEEDSIKTIKNFKDKKIKVLSTSLNKSKYIGDIDFNEGCLFIIGNESRGVSSSLSKLSDDLIKIPMKGQAESLNVAIASSIIMYEAMKQRGQ